jgi:hypothetical protein
VRNRPVQFQHNKKSNVETMQDRINKIHAILNLKNAVFWDVAPCRSCENRRFGGTYYLHHQGRKIRERGTSVNSLQSHLKRNSSALCTRIGVHATIQPAVIPSRHSIIASHNTDPSSHNFTSNLLYSIYRMPDDDLHMGRNM